jgi:hypothetical protein
LQDYFDPKAWVLSTDNGSISATSPDYSFPRQINK